MSKRQNEFLIDTCVIEDHLTHSSSQKNSNLENLLMKGICFTTVLNASEALLKVSSEAEERIVIDVLSGLKILGLHPRYSLRIPKYSSSIKNLRDALFCVVADYNKLPIITLSKSKYSKSKLNIYHPREVLACNNSLMI